MGACSIRTASVGMGLLAFVMLACGRSNSAHSAAGGAAAAAGGGGTGGAHNAPAGGSSKPAADCAEPAAQPRCDGEFCRIEPGCFLMGAPPLEWGRGRVSTNQVQVTITRAFELGRSELTRKQWEEAGFAQPKQHAQYGLADCVDPDCPQGNINFFDAVTLINRLSERSGLPACYALAGCSGEVGNGLSCSSVQISARTVYECTGYRLPTEAEWEYAARAGVRTAFMTGDVTVQPDPDCYEDKNLEPIGWYCFNSGKQAHRVAQKLPNGWGLYDIAGNVHEWCNDVYKPAGYGQGPLKDPTGMLGDPANLTLKPGEQFRITRGGDYLMPAYSSKVNWHTDFSDATFGANVGARLARTLGSPR